MIDDLIGFRRRLLTDLEETGDPRVGGQGDIWETYPRYSPLRWLPTPPRAREDPARVPRQDWLEERPPGP